MITGKLYEVLKWVAQIVLPGVGALYLALAALWNLPAPQEVSGTVLAVDTFLGVLLGISQVNYGKQVAGGVIQLDETDDRMTYKLKLNDDPEELMNMSEARFKIQHTPE